MRADRGAGAARRSGFRNKTTIAVLSGSLAVLPMIAVSDATVRWLDIPEQEQSAPAPLVGGQPHAPVSVNGSLPETPTPEELWVPTEPVTGSLGIPSSALDAYKRAAERVAAEYPGCNIDWALLASIGRIESNHARGGYVDDDGDSLESILGPVLDGTGDVAAIADTDGGAYDGDTRWDRAVGPMQFIPSTWKRYAADGNGDGVADPDNLYDATLAAGRYLCSGGVDLSDPEQLRAAVYRYNNSWSYVNTVIRWAKAYRSGVSTLPDSDVPTAVLAHAPNEPDHEETSEPLPPSEAPSPVPTTPDEPDEPSDPSPEDPPPPDGEDPPPSDGEDPPPADGEDPPPSDGEDPPPDGEDPTDPGECEPEDDPSSPEPTDEQSEEESSGDETSTDEPTEPGESDDPAEPTEPPCDDESDDETGDEQPDTTTPGATSATTSPTTSGTATTGTTSGGTTTETTTSGTTTSSTSATREPDPDED
ncbi:lytic murein transglycosylase [Saccharomonospora sp.]|uniref:lytic transglycosylase domain-containing protein n=1 Tax=Saccharomonospora sp. TaxID=33913 RepID=UPI00261A3711|nr:lytic murein transglycosylase [Saccharomonospora sp.]